MTFAKMIFPAALLLALAACGPKAKNEAAEANEMIGGDSNTMGEAAEDVNAAEAAIPNGTEAPIENLADVPAGSGDEGSGDEIIE